MLQSAPLKNEKKNLKKDASHLKVSRHGTKQKKNIEKRERKTKMRKSQTTTIILFLLLLFYIEKFMFC